MELMRLHTPCETIVMRLYFSFSDTDWLPKIWYLGLSCRKKAPASRGNQPRLGGSQVSTWRCLQRPEKHPRRKAVTRGQIRRRRSWNWESPIRKNRRRRTRVPQAQWTTTPATNDLKVRRRRWIHRRVGLKSYFIFLSRVQSKFEHVVEWEGVLRGWKRCQQHQWTCHTRSNHWLWWPAWPLSKLIVIASLNGLPLCFSLIIKY